MEATEPTLMAAPWREMLAKKDAILGDLEYQFSVNSAISNQLWDLMHVDARGRVNSRDNSFFFETTLRKS